MKIAIISSAAMPVPVTDGYGGLEALMGWLAMDFVKNKNDVTVFTTKGSSWGEGNHPVSNGNEILGNLNVVETIDPKWDGNAEFDHYKSYKDILEKEFSDGNSIVLDSTWLCCSYLSKKQFPKMNLIHVHHGMLGFQRPPSVLFPRFLGLSSRHAQYMSSSLNIPVRFVHNGIPLVQFPQDFDPLSPSIKGDYLLSLNRITDEKGIHDAIDIAIATNTPIIVAGDDTHVISQQYVNQTIERCRNSGGLAQYLGLVDTNTKNLLIQKCKALITTPKPTWIEAFGLNVVEAMAYYKPVLALKGGAFFQHGYNDIIQHGINGFLAQTPEELKQYVEKIDDIDVRNCRTTVEQNFTKEKMASRYLELFEKILFDDETTKW